MRSSETRRPATPRPAEAAGQGPDLTQGTNEPPGRTAKPASPAPLVCAHLRVFPDFHRLPRPLRLLDPPPRCSAASALPLARHAVLGQLQLLDRISSGLLGQGRQQKKKNGGDKNTQVMLFQRSALKTHHSQCHALF